MHSCSTPRLILQELIMRKSEALISLCIRRVTRLRVRLSGVGGGRRVCPSTRRVGCGLVCLALFILLIYPLILIILLIYPLIIRISPLILIILLISPLILLRAQVSQRATLKGFRAQVSQHNSCQCWS
jgi:hypothetical protein